MEPLLLDKYMDKYNWKEDSGFVAILNTVASRKFQPPKLLNLTVEENNSLGRISKARVDRCQYSLRTQRNYNHKVYDYDNMNELERYGLGRYARKYIVIVSFEDCLDFIYSCLFKTKQGSLIEFCKNNELDYLKYSRQHLAGGEVDKVYLTDFRGFSPSFDIILNSIPSDSSIEKTIYFSRLSRFCESFRNALLKHFGTSINGNSDTILASAGITSLVFYSHVPIDDYISVRYKTYNINLKLLCVEAGEYFNSINESLCF